LNLKVSQTSPWAFDLYLSVKEPWKDELVTNEVDLARPEIEHFTRRKAVWSLTELIINGAFNTFSKKSGQ